MAVDRGVAVDGVAVDGVAVDGMAVDDAIGGDAVGGTGSLQGPKLQHGIIGVRWYTT